MAPGTVAGLVPWLLTRWHSGSRLPHWVPLRVAGGLILALAVWVLVLSFTRFVSEGIGTPAPVAPTRHLVVGGLYGYVRNPMYLAVVTAIFAQSLLLVRLELLVYGTLVWLTFVVFVRWYEEPTLNQQFGAEYEAYRQDVRPWWPSLKPWKPGSTR
jgi:protein-S-isoprenylcysteine O-methyltransferase Ste14